MFFVMVEREQSLERFLLQSEPISVSYLTSYVGAGASVEQCVRPAIEKFLCSTWLRRRPRMCSGSF
jgi:hypothetical protein